MMCLLCATWEPADKQIARVFLFEGRMISAIGAIIGIGIGLLLCLLQQEFGFVKLGDSLWLFHR